MSNLNVSYKDREYLTIDEAADFLRRSPETLRWWRSNGKGPPAFKSGRRVLYSFADLVTYMEREKEEAGVPDRPRSPWPVGDALVEWCTRNSITQAWLARATGITDKHLSAIITGRSLFSPEVAVQLSRVTGIPAKTLFALQNDRLVEIATDEAKGPSNGATPPHSEG